MAITPIQNLLQKMHLLSEVKVLINVPFVQKFYPIFFNSLHTEAFEILRKMSKFTKKYLQLKLIAFK